MEALIIHNPEVSESVAMAEQAFASCSFIEGLKPVMHVGCRKQDAERLAVVAKLEVGIDYIERKQWRPLRDGQIGAFLAHRSVWLRTVEKNEPVVVLEHDVTFTRPDTIPAFDSVLNLQRMIWDDPQWPWHNKMKQFTGKYDNGNAKYYVMPGVCAYAITPNAAKTLLAACSNGMIPVDLFMNKTVVKIDDHPNINGLVHVKNDFSTVRPGSVQF